MSQVPGIELVGIAAPTCAGKTSLLDELGRRMAATTMFSFDEYDLYPTGSEAMDREMVEKRITNWEDPALFDMEQYIIDLGRIAQGQKVILQTRSRESLSEGQAQRILIPSSLNIIEGVFVLYDPRARALLDLKCFIDIPLEVMVERRLKAARYGNPDDPWNDPAYITGAMVEGTKRYVMPQREHPGVVVFDGLLPTDKLADQVMSRINSL